MRHNNQYQGQVQDRLGDDIRFTRYYDTWEAAQKAAEALCSRLYGRHNDRYRIVVTYNGEAV